MRLILSIFLAFQATLAFAQLRTPDSVPLDSFSFSKQGNIIYLEEGGEFRPMRMSDLSPSISAFGESITAKNFPYIQSAPVNNFLPANFRAYSASGGSGTVENNQFKASSGVSVGGYGAIQSFRSVNYKAGQGGLARFTARFPNGGVANSWQGVGLINLGDELSFGYNGLQFGIWHRHNGLAEVRLLTLSAGASGAETGTFVINNTTYNIPLTSGTAQKNANEIETYLNANGAGFAAYQQDNTVMISFLSDGPKTGTFSYAGSGTSAGSLSTVTTGVTKTSDFIAQTDWNIDTRPTLDPTKGNVYQVSYQYLGYGNIFFCIEDPDTGRFAPVHMLKYANANTSPSLGNPSMHLGLYAASVGSTTNIDVYSASMAAFSQGEVEPVRNPRSFSNVKNIGTTATNLLTIRNKRIVNGLNNQQEIEPLILTVFTESNKGATIEIKTGATLGGNTNYLPAGNVNQLSQYDISGTTVTGGTTIASFVIPGNSSTAFDLNALRVRVPPTLTITISARVNSGTAADTGAALTWYEDV